MEFKDLLIDHDYYCSSSNYYSNEGSMTYNTWQEFYNDFKDADIDYNLVFRWDLREKEEGGYYMEIFLILQRKGIFRPVTIKTVEETDFDTIYFYLQPHYDKLMRLWQPFSK